MKQPQVRIAKPGETYGAWMVTSVPTREEMKSEGRWSHPSAYRWCTCTCGERALVAVVNLARGKSRSCRKCAAQRRAVAQRTLLFDEHSPAADPKTYDPDSAGTVRTLLEQCGAKEAELNRREDTIKRQETNLARQANLLRAKAHQLKTLRDKLKKFARENNIEWPSAD